MGAYISGGGAVSYPIAINKGGTNQTAFAIRKVLRYNAITGKVENGGHFSIGNAAASAGSSITINANDDTGIIATYGFSGTGGATINLPPAAAEAGRIIFIKDADGTCNGGDTITILPNGADTIDGAGSLVLSNAFSSVIIASVAIAALTHGWAVLEMYPP